MPDPSIASPEHVPFYAKIINWLVAALVGAWIFIFNNVIGKVKANAAEITELKKALNADQLAHAKEHEKLMTTDAFQTYVKDELKPLITGVGTRVDTELKEVKGLLNKVIDQTTNVIKRDEYKPDIVAIHNRIDKKQDKL